MDRFGWNLGGHITWAALFYSPVDFTDASDMHHSNASLMHRWINRWIKQRSHTMSCMSGLTLFLVFVAAAGQLVSYSERRDWEGPAANQRPSNAELGECTGNVDSCPQVLYVSFSCVSMFSLVLDSRGWLGGLAEKVESACKEFEDNDGGTLGQCFWEFCCQFTGLFKINGHWMVVVDVEIM